MAAKNNKNTESEKKYFDVTGMKAINIRRLGKSGVIAFSLLGNGVGFYNLRIVEGKNGEFIAAPQSKGSDGKYYSQYAVYITDEDQARIIKAVKAKAPDPEPAEQEDDGIDF